MSDARREGRTGMTDKDMEKLESENASGRLNPPLTREQQDALRFMRKNYDALKNGWTTDLPIFGRVGREGITPGSFDRNKTNTDPVENLNPRTPQERTGPNQQQRRADTQAAPNFGDTTVRRGNGPYQVAQRMLDGQNLDNRSLNDLTKVLDTVRGGRTLREGEEMINEGNLEDVRRKVEATNNPKLKAWFEKRYPKA